MITTRVRCFFIIGLIAFLTWMRAMASEENEVQCRKDQAFFGAAEFHGALHYAPDRDVTVLHLALDVTPDFLHRTIAGTAIHTFKPAIKPVQEIKLDAVRLKVDSVKSSHAIRAYQVTDENLIVTFSNPIPVGEETTLTIQYSCEPTIGIYFRTPEMGYKEGDTHLFSQGEETDERNWYPCFDSPNEKFTSEITCHVTNGMTVISNGRLVSEETNSATGMVSVHWAQEKPHANYLITLVAGYFKKLEAMHKDIPLGFLTPPSEFADAASSFRETDEIMTFFEKEIGVPYPWAKYYQICVNDFVEGGMENTSATTLTDGTLFRDETESIRNSQSLVSHEMAHQWFGDLVTCKDWSHIWLNEGAATYYQVLYDGFKNGHDSLLYGLYKNARAVTSVPNDTNAIVRRNFKETHELFGYLAYPKGGWVLHMLRSQLGEDLYRQCIRTYLDRHMYGSVTTEDLRQVIEELTGRSYDQFFDQWVYHAHYPELEVEYSWDELTRLAKLSVQQAKPVENALVFDIEMPVRFKGKFGSIDRSIHIKSLQEDFYFSLEAAPDIVRMDPGYTLLTKISMKLPSKMLYAQLEDSTDVIGRLQALEQLSSKQDKETVAKIQYALNHDGFFGVRYEASAALKLIHTDQALAALLESTHQPEARVRNQVVTDIGGFYENTAYDFEKSVLGTDKNPIIISSAIRGLSAYGKTADYELLLKYLNSDSFEQQLARAAILAIRTQDDPSYAPALMKCLGRRGTDFNGRLDGEGLATLAYISRNEEKKDSIREFLAGELSNKKQNVKLAAIRALGTLGDPKAIGILEKYSTASTASPEREAAEQSVVQLRAARKPVDDFKNLREEVMELKKANQSLRRDVDDLKTKLGAVQGAGSSGKALDGSVKKLKSKAVSQP